MKSILRGLKVQVSIGDEWVRYKIGRWCVLYFFLSG